MLRKTWFKNVLLLAVVAVGLWWFFNRGASRVEAYEAPSWRLQDLQGEWVDSEHFRGEVVVLNFWATWCPPCRMEIPGFVEAQEELAEEGVRFVGISLDQAPVGTVREFAERMAINYPVVMGDARVVQDFGQVEVLPTTFFIDRRGQVRNRHTGYLTKGSLMRTLKPLIRESPEG